MSASAPFSDADIDHFMEQGFVYLRGGFPRQLAEPVFDLIWPSMKAGHGIDRDDPATWTLQSASPPDHPAGPACAALYTPRVRAALDQLLGAGRWLERGDRTGAWPITFPGHHDGPWRSAGNWHIDGGGQRTLCGPSQALIAIMLFSDIGPGDGGTAVRVGSHRSSARILLEHEPDGLSQTDFMRLATEASRDLPVVEAQGEIGDLIICHGYLVHSSSTNGGAQPRVITNNCITLLEPAVLDRPDPAGLSPYERSLIAATRGQPA